MSTKERYQNITLGDQVNLDFFHYKNNSLVDVHQINSVEIYFLDKLQISNINPNGKCIKKIISSNDIEKISDGHYRVVLLLDSDLYEVGDFVDIWKIKFDPNDEKFQNIENQFIITRQLSETRDRPFIYDCDFKFSPKKIMKDSKKNIVISFKPTIHSDIGTKNCLDENIERFYFNLRTSQNLFVRIRIVEGCGFNSEYYDGNLKTGDNDSDWSSVSIRGDNEAYYIIDSTEDGDFDIGVYEVQFKILIDEQTIISPKFYMQIIG